MRVITLNCWGGRRFGPLKDMIEEYHEEVDVWCLQEVPTGSLPEANACSSRDNLFNEISALLTGHNGFAYPSRAANYCGEKMRHGTDVGMAMFVRKEMNAQPRGNTQLYENNCATSMTPELRATGRLQTFTVTLTCGRQIVVANIHGIWQRVGKIDTLERSEQSRRIIDFISGTDLPILLAGDLNLGPELRSLRALEDAGLRNLIREFGIPTTRTPLYAPVYDKRDPYADYIFTRGCGAVHECRVLPNLVSDHAAVLADFDL